MRCETDQPIATIPLGQSDICTTNSQTSMTWKLDLLSDESHEQEEAVCVYKP